jgi:hypothetical protein
VVSCFGVCKVVTASTCGITDESTITTTLDNMQKSIQSYIQSKDDFIRQELDVIRQSVINAINLSTEANAKIDNAQKGYDLKSIILRRILFGDPLLEMVDSAIADHPELDDHMNSDGVPIHPHSHPLELEKELNNISFDALRSLMLTSRDFVMLTGALKCTICMKRVDRGSGSIVVCDMCEAPFHLGCSNCITYGDDEEGRSICRHCRNVRRCVLAVELIKHCPVCSSYADQIEQRIISASTATHIRHRFNSLELVTHRLISDKAFEMLQKAENEVLQVEMANSHKDAVDPELDASVLNSSLLDEINGTNDCDIADNAQGKIPTTRPPTPEADKKPAAVKSPPEGTPSSSLKGRKLNFKPIQTTKAMKPVPEASDLAATDEDDYMSVEGEQLLSRRKDDLGRKTPPPEKAMDTSASGSSKSSKSSHTKLERSRKSEDTPDSAERRYEERQKRTLKSAGTRSHTAKYSTAQVAALQ